MKLQLDKPWIELTEENVRVVPGQLGLYQLSSSGGAIEKIGFAGGKELFGLRSALGRELAVRGRGFSFRYEVNMQYQSRWQELLMLHRRAHGSLPPGNVADRPARLGRMA